MKPGSFGSASYIFAREICLTRAGEQLSYL